MMIPTMTLEILSLMSIHNLILILLYLLYQQPRTINLFYEKINLTTKSATTVWELSMSWEVATIQSEREM